MSDDLRRLIRESVRELAFTEFLVEFGGRQSGDPHQSYAAAMDKLKDVVFGTPGEYTLQQITKMVAPVVVPNLAKVLDSLVHKGLVKKRMTERGVMYIVS